MKSLSKISTVIIGYIIAFLVASIVLYIYVAAVDSPERQASSGMTAFGDSILFLAIFTLAAIPATCAALSYLRSYTAFWRVSSIGSLGIAITGIAGLLAYIINFGSTSHFYYGSMLSPLRLLLAPAFAIAFFLCALFAPTPVFRNRFIGASVIELSVFVIWFVGIWFNLYR